MFRGKLVRQWSHAWDALVSCTSDLYPAELFGDIKRAFEDDLVDCSFIDLDWVERSMAMGKEETLARLADDSHRRLVDDTVAEMEWWGCFHENRGAEADQRKDAPARVSLTPGIASPSAAPAPTVSSPIVNASLKIGRNEPCPCGSGKKFKKCCGA